MYDSIDYVLLQKMGLRVDEGLVVCMFQLRERMLPSKNNLTF